VGEVAYRRMRAEEREPFLALMEAAFVDEDPGLFARYLDHDPLLGPEDTLVAVEGGAIVSAVQVFTRRLRLRGETVLLGGIGSVATRPACEGRGLASALLRGAVDDMQARGMTLSLLFTGRQGFYGRLGWVALPHPVWAVRHRDALPPQGARGFTDADLPAVRALYDAYAARRPGATIRDDAYWRGQLRFAGNPDERFDVVERGGRVVAYARRIPFHGTWRIMEYGRADDAAEALAGLIVSLVQGDAPLLVPAGDPALGAALAARADACDDVAFPEQMWRVIDDRRARALAGASPEAADAEVLAALVTGPASVFWPSDRF